MKKLIVALSAATLLTACSTTQKAEGMAQETLFKARGLIIEEGRVTFLK